MLSDEIDNTRMALSELSDSVTPQQWGLIRACIQDLGAVAKKMKGIEEILSPNQRQPLGA